MLWNLEDLLRRARREGQELEEPDRIIEAGSAADGDSIVVGQHTLLYPGMINSRSVLVDCDFWGK